MENSKTPAFPHMVIETDAIDGSTIRNIEYDGLTKREYAAIMAMQATDLEAYANAFGKDWAKKVSEDAILLADELLKQLEQK